MGFFDNSDLKPKEDQAKQSGNAGEMIDIASERARREQVKEDLSKDREHGGLDSFKPENQ